MPIIPPYLKVGDKVAIAATARKVSPDEIAPSIRLLKSWGLDVVIPDGLFAEHGQLAGSDSHRAQLLQRLVDDDEVKAIFCARGGYGTVRIIDGIDWSQFAQRPKWIIGYSDVTVLHSHIQHNLGISTLHATMPINITDAALDSWPETDALRSLHDALFNEEHNLQLKGEVVKKDCNTTTIEGDVVGGNLSILYSLCGSPSDIDTDGKILLIEDLDEYLYHVDRMMQNLLRSGKLNNIKALLVGSMSDMHDNAIPFGMNCREIILNATETFGYPLIFTEEIGHVGLKNKAIRLGTPYRIDFSNSENIVLESQP